MLYYFDLTLQEARFLKVTANEIAPMLTCLQLLATGEVPQDWKQVDIF